MTVIGYTASRDQICSAAGVKATPVKARLAPLYEPAAADAEKADAIAALREYLALGTIFTDELAALDVPPDMLAEHAANVANFRDILIVIGESLALHDAGKTGDALAVDLATNGIAAQINAFEGRLGLTP